MTNRGGPMKLLAALALSLVVATGSSAPASAKAAAGRQDKPAPKLQYKVFTASGPGFLVNSTLIYGEKEAVLIDGMFLLSDAAKVAEAVKAMKLRLTTVFVTHAHPDHYFGMPAIRKVFPDAKLVAFKPVVEE